MVLERSGDVCVPGQRVEVVLFAVVDRRFVAHPQVDLVRVVEVLLRKRVEDDLRGFLGAVIGLFLRCGLIGGKLRNETEL